jgi:hypothetical protein
VTLFRSRRRKERERAAAMREGMAFDEGWRQGSGTMLAAITPLYTALREFLDAQGYEYPDAYTGERLQDAVPLSFEQLRDVAEKGSGPALELWRAKGPPA